MKKARFESLDILHIDLRDGVGIRDIRGDVPKSL